MLMQFRFDTDWYSINISENPTEDINKAIWVLLHTLKAKEVKLGEKLI